MIKVNLLKNFQGVAGSDFTTAADRDAILKQAGKKLAVCLIGPIALYIYEINNLPGLQKKLAQVNSQITEVQQFNNKKQALADEIKQYKINQQKIDTQVKFLNIITSEKQNEVRLLSLVQEAVPNGMWLSSLRIDSNNVVVIGECDSQEGLGQFLVRLNNSEFLEQVQLSNQESKKDNLGVGIPTVVFNIKAKFRVPDGEVGI